MWLLSEEEGEEEEEVNQEGRKWRGFCCDVTSSEALGKSCVCLCFAKKSSLLPVIDSAAAARETHMCTLQMRP